ncbi:MAG: hypothetical protein OXT70_03510 [Chloroflexota bacterium]|nr:hypothetical protein [Chloroflexota bacterium]
MEQRTERSETLLGHLPAIALMLFMLWNWSVLLVNGNHLGIYHPE